MHDILSGVRVLDLTRFVAGPYCTMLLGDLGADVIKIEHPGRGDGTRKWGSGSAGPDNPFFLSVNRNKRSVAVDLKSESGQLVIHKLISVSDVFISNFRPGVLERLGLSQDHLRECYPQLIVSDVSGFGNLGPDQERPGVDFVIQATTGLMSLLGDPSAGPSKVPFPLFDVIAGLIACVGVTSCLAWRSETGVGAHVSTSLLEAALDAMPGLVSSYLISGEVPKRMGSKNPYIAPYEVFEATDGSFAFGTATEPQWARLCELIGRSDLASDSRFRSNPERLENRDALVAELTPVFAAERRNSWLKRLRDAGIPCSAIEELPATVQSKQVAALEIIEPVGHPVLGEIRMVKPALNVNGRRLSIRRPPPTLGEHTREVLVDVLDMDSSEVDRLYSIGAVGRSA